MKSLGRLFSELDNLGVFLWLEEGRLRYRCQKSTDVDWKAEVAERKSEIIQFLNQSNQQQKEASPLYYADKPPLLPLSFAQQRMWFVNQLQGRDEAYNMPIALECVGQLDTTTMKACINAIVNRHDALRIYFHMHDGITQQQVASEIITELPIVDLSALPQTQRQNESNRLAERESCLAFNFFQGPLFRTLLIRQDKQTHTLLWTLHHIVTDGWSNGILARELGILYQAFRQNKPSPLAKLTANYSDYVLWQREQANSEQVKQQLAYWQQQLAGAPTLSAFPTDHSRPALQTFNGAKHRFHLDKKFYPQLKETARQFNITMFMVLHAALLALLQRYSGNDDLVIGTVVANRTHKDLEPMVGHFLNMLALRTDLSSAVTITDLFNCVRKTDLAAFEHQNATFEQVFEAIQPDRSLSHSPLFQVVMIYQNTPGGSLELPDLTVSMKERLPAAGYYDLTFTIEEGNNELLVLMEYNKDLFDASTINRLFSHYQNLLNNLVENPHQRLDKLSLMGEDEINKLITSKDRIKLLAQNEGRLEQIFTQRVIATPNAIALFKETKEGQQQLTYQELNNLANGLALQLYQRGVKAEQPVAICLDRSMETVIAILGVLKAGATYVPLDPSNPSSRLKLILQDSGVQVAISESKHTHIFSGLECALILTDKDTFVPSDDITEQNRQLATESAAYIIYTSGSTGTPKGVVGTHLGVLNRLQWMWARYPYANNEICCHKTTLSFVDSVAEIFGPLLAGIPALILSNNSVKDPDSLIDALTTHQVTRLVVVPSLLRTILTRYKRLQNKPSMPNLWVTSGEELPWDIVQQFRESFPTAILANFYGSSEVAADITYYSLEANNLNHQTLSSVPIGQSISNSHAYILDRWEQLTAPGVVGDLYVAGDGLARGYYNNPRFTAERFVPNPFNTSKHSRLFRTGDLACYLNDGTIAFLGRRDYQVKIRGFRIELGEIESIIQQHPQVKQTVVVVDESSEQLGKRLVAYICMEAESTNNDADTLLRHFIAERAPDYMVPSIIMMVDNFNLTSSGKIDRLALPQAHITTSTQVTLAKTQTQQQLMAIWEQILELNTNTISIDSNFFELGGHSLLATKLATRIYDEFAIELPIQMIFKLSTIAQLSHYIDNHPELKINQKNRDNESTSPFNQLTHREHKPRLLPLSFAQQRLWIYNQIIGQDHMNHLSMALKLEGKLDPIVLELCLNELLKRHDSLRTRINPNHNPPKQEIIDHKYIKLPIVDFTGLTKQQCEYETEQFFKRESELTFDLNNEPPFRLYLIKSEINCHTLLWIMHHIVTDGWSNNAILANELGILYRAFSKNQASPLPELAIHFSDYLIWQQEQISSSTTRQQLEYWEHQLKGAPAVSLSFPTDNPRPPARGLSGKHYHVRWQKTLFKQMSDFALQHNVSMFMVFHALLLVLMHRYSGDQDIVIAAGVAGRTHKKIEPIVGLFLNKLLLRTPCEAGLSFNEIIQNVEQTDMAALTHQDVAFDQVAEVAKPYYRNLGVCSFAQTQIYYQNLPGGKFELPDLQLSMSSLGPEVTVQDLVFTVEESHEGLDITVEYDTDLFEHNSIIRIMRNLEHLTQSILQQPNQAIDQVALLNHHDRNFILTSSTGLTTITKQTKLFSELFQNKVDTAPNSLAVICGSHQLTYIELNNLSNLIASKLCKQELPAGSVIGVLTNDSLFQLATIIATLKLGFAYLPLATEYSEQYLYKVITDTDISAIFTDLDCQSSAEKLLQEYKYTKSIALLCYGSLDNSLSNPEKSTIVGNIQVNSEDLAYVSCYQNSNKDIKKTMISQQALTHLFYLKDGELNVDDNLKFTQAGELYIPSLLNILTIGGCINLIDNKLLTNPRDLLLSLEKSEVSVLEITPKVLRKIIFCLGSMYILPSLSKLRYIISAGSILRTELVKEWFYYYPQISLINSYRPIEGLLSITSQLILHKPLSNRRSLPIGKPAANSGLYILDQTLELVPIGMPGELFVQFMGFSQAYSDNPALTSELSIPNPFSKLKHQKLYRTGDMAVRLEDGSVEILGQIERRVRFKGTNIQLDEIESILLCHKSVDECTVILASSDNGIKQMVAYLKINPANSLSEADLKEFLRSTQSEYLIPDRFIFVDSIPKANTSHSDINKVLGFSYEEHTQLPKDELENKLIDIWQEILAVRNINITDNFFEFGGDSFTALSTIKRINKELGIHLEAKILFSVQNILELAQVIRENRLEPDLARCRA